MRHPSFSIILPTYNRAAVVETTLRHLLAVDYPPNRYEVLVADNSTDDTPEMVERMAAGADVRVRLVASDERLPAVKRNQALREAEGELALFLNDDLWVRPDFLLEHAATHLAHDEPIAVLGHVDQSPRMPPTPFTEWYVPFPYHEIAHRRDAEVPWRYFWSMNISLPRAEMLERGLIFHEDWAEIGHEDVELGYRWTRSGHTIVYNPRAWGEHYHPHTLDSACRLQESIGRGLRDLEWLVPDPGLLERYGVFSWGNSPSAVLRGLARKALFNRWTVPTLQRWLGGRSRNTPLTRWMYWKVMLHYTDRGYRGAPLRRPERLTVGEPAIDGGSR